MGNKQDKNKDKDKYKFNQINNVIEEFPMNGVLNTKLKQLSAKHFKKNKNKERVINDEK